MDFQVWLRQCNEKIKKLKEAGDTEGVRKLEFARFVRNMRRIVPKLSQSKAAELSGLSRSHWARIEAGTHIPKPKKFPRMAGVLRVQVHMLYRKARYEVPERYLFYDLKEATRSFAIALKESFSFEEFIARMQEVWQLFHQEAPKKERGFLVDQRRAELIAEIYQMLTPPERIKLAKELVRSVEHRTIRANLRDATAVLKELEQKVELLADPKSYP